MLQNDGEVQAQAEQAGLSRVMVRPRGADRRRGQFVGEGARDELLQARHGLKSAKIDGFGPFSRSEFVRVVA